MNFQKKFDSLTVEQRIMLLNKYDWNIRKSTHEETLMIDDKDVEGTFFVISVKEGKKKYNIGYDTNPADAIVSASYKLGARGWITEQDVDTILTNPQ